MIEPVSKETTGIEEKTEMANQGLRQLESRFEPGPHMEKARGSNMSKPMIVRVAKGINIRKLFRYRVQRS
jgi:hypothetical protein